MIVLSITKDLTMKYNAGNIIKEVAESIGSGGGGPAHFGTAGFNDMKLYNKAYSHLEELLKDIKF